MKQEARVAVVTGAAQGIGRRTAELLAERGYRLAIIDLRQPVEIVDAIESAGGEAFGYSGNIADESVVANFARAHMLVALFDGDPQKWIEFLNQNAHSRHRGRFRPDQRRHPLSGWQCPFPALPQRIRRG